MKKLLLLILFALPIFAQMYAKLPAATTCNVVGDRMTDDTAAIQACINAAPDDSEVVFPSGVLMKITTTLHVDGRYGLSIRGQTGVFGGPSAATPAPSFYWAGPDGGTMMTVNRSDNLVVSNLTFFTSNGYLGGTGGANVGIDVDRTLPSGGTGTNDRFEKISIISGTQNPNFQGIRFAQATPNQNVENMTVRDSNIYCSYGGKVGRGIVIGPGGFYNAKKHLYENNRISSCATAIYLTGGSASILYNDFNLTTTDIYAAPVDPMVIQGNNSENSVQFFTGPLTAPILMSGNRIAAVTPPAGEAAVWITSGGSQVLTFQGNKFDGGSFMPVGFSTNTGGSLDSSGNTYPYGGNTLGGFYTVPYTFTSRNDQYVNVLTKVDGGSAPGFLMGGGYFHHIGGLVYDDYSQRWKITNEISNSQAAVGHMVVSEPAGGLTISPSASALGSCGAGSDLLASSNGVSLSSATIFFQNADAGGYIHIDPVNGWTGGDYYIASAWHSANISDAVPGNSSGGSFTVNRGRMVLKQGAAGVADTMWVCAQTTAGYAWKQVF